MIYVKLYRTEAGTMTEIGALEFFGTPIPESAGSSWIELEAGEQPCAGHVRLTPAHIATGQEIRIISESLCRNELNGKAGRYEWALTPSTP
jgi:hypothetical protein